MPALRIFIALLAPLAAALVHGADESAVRIEPRQRWSAHFGNRDAVLTFDVTPARKFDGRCVWSYSAKGRTIARGEIPIASDAGQPAAVVVKLKTPPIKNGVIFRTDLAVAVVEQGNDQPTARVEKTIWLFPDDAFADRRKWFDAMNIVLFDARGDTARTFDDANIPYRQVRNAAALAEVRQGLIVVGEGASLTDYPGLLDSLVQAAAQGVPVLCLAPHDGGFTWPGSATEGPLPKRLELRRQDIIAELDHRLDAHAWPPDGGLAACGVLVRGHNDRAIGEISTSREAWPWFEVRFDRASLVVCGFGVIRRFDDGPTPRYLLVRMFEHLTRPAGPALNEG